MRESVGPASVAARMLPIHERLYDGGDAAAALGRTVELARDLVPGCDHAAVTEWSVTGVPSDVARTDPVTAVIDELHHLVSDGPWTFAPPDEGFVHIEDVEYDGRWPVFTEAVAVRTPVRSLLSYRFPVGERALTLNFCAERSGAFDADAISLADRVVVHARAVLLHAGTARARASSALASSGLLVAKAVGILAGRNSVSHDDAFAELLRRSRDARCRLHDIAAQVVAANPPGADSEADTSTLARGTGVDGD